jgi:hypothetical protein
MGEHRPCAGKGMELPTLATGIHIIRQFIQQRTIE